MVSNQVEIIKKEYYLGVELERRETGWAVTGYYLEK